MSRESIPPIFYRLFDRRQAVLALLNGWFYIIIFAAGGIWYAVHELQHAENFYSAQMQVTAAQSAESPANSQISAVAALAAIAAPVAQTGSQFGFYVDSLTSRNIADALAKNPRVMHTIFADQWDEATQTWHPPAEDRWMRYRRRIKEFLRLPSEPWHAPDGEQLLYFLTGNLQVFTDPRKPYITKVSILWPDRDFAIYFLNLLHQTADNMLRQKEIQRTSQNIAFLSRTLATITVAEHRAAIAQVLSEEEKRAMTARNDQPFTAELFERPWASTLPTLPVPSQSIMWGAITGALIGYLLAFIQWHMIKPHVGRWLSFRRPRRIVTQPGPG